MSCESILILNCASLALLINCACYPFFLVASTPFVTKIILKERENFSSKGARVYYDCESDELEIGHARTAL